MATELTNPTTAVMTEQSSSSSSADDQQQHLSSSSSTVSQSPIQENNDLSADSCSNYTTSNVDAAPSTSTSSLQPQQRSNANTSTIINPYKKQTTNPPSTTHQQHQDPNTHKRRQFIEKYRLQAVHTNTTHYRQRGKSASIATSKSALEVLRLNQEWRQQWRRRGQQQHHHQQSGDDSCAIVDNGNDCSQQSALRPRLFLFQRMMPPQLIEHNPMTTSQQKQQGVWELGTGINEISGEGGSGKTQICLTLCLTCALTPLLFAKENGNNNSNNNHQLYYTSIYITMGEGIPQSKIATRLHQMLGHRRHNNAEDDPDEMERILSRIWLLSLKNEDDFIEFIEVHLPNILNNQSHGIKPQQQQQPLPNNQYPTCDKIGLIAFDGIANFFRFSDPLFQQYQTSSAYNQSSMFHQNRSSKLFQLSSLLRRMSDVYDVPIVITNQVTTSIPSDDGLLKRPPPPPPSSSVMGGGQDGNRIQPALGLIWSNCVTTRFILQRKDGLMAKISTGGSRNDNGNASVIKKEGAATTTTTTMQRVRKACVLQSVCTPEESEVWYFIDTGAVVAVSLAQRSGNR
eukprot:scaffold35620_cov155-Skeletonema_dohrnii-CCMP3373.AAC.1